MIVSFKPKCPFCGDVLTKCYMQTVLRKITPGIGKDIVCDANYERTGKLDAWGKIIRVWPFYISWRVK